MTRKFLGAQARHLTCLSDRVCGNSRQRPLNQFNRPLPQSFEHALPVHSIRISVRRISAGQLRTVPGWRSPLRRKRIVAVAFTRSENG